MRDVRTRQEGAQRPGYTGQRGYHPLLAVAAGTGDVLMARLRSGRAYSGRGAAHFLQETVGRVRGAGASGRLTVRADSGVATPADAALMMRLGAEGVFVGSGIFKSENPPAVASAVVQAVTHYQDDELLAQVSRGLGPAMRGLAIASLPEEEVLAKRGW